MLDGTLGKVLTVCTLTLTTAYRICKYIGVGCHSTHSDVLMGPCQRQKGGLHIIRQVVIVLGSPITYMSVTLCNQNVFANDMFIQSILFPRSLNSLVEAGVQSQRQLTSNSYGLLPNIHV